jgi:[histone H3]-dimethyl-L-lysine9 demethylase
MLTQIIAGDSLQILGQKIHEVRTLWGIPQHCECSFEKHKIISKQQSDIVKDLLQSQPNCLFRDKKTSVQDSCIDSDSDSDKSTNDETEQTSALRDLLTFDDNVLNDSTASTKKTSSSDTEKNIISHATEEDFVKSSVELRHYISKTKRNVTFLPTRIMTLAQSRTLYPVPHQWLCDGKLLRLLDAAHPSNYKIFQEQWKRGQPVIVSSVTKRLKSDLWHPNAFSREFGEEKFDLINCISGTLLPNQPLKKFWDGFDNISMRLKDEKGNPMLLKLKDWPPGEDFSEVLPSR